MYAANYSVVCDDWIPNKLAKLATYGNRNILDEVPCNVGVGVIDFNLDGFINFREFISLVSIIGSKLFNYAIDQAININCSYYVGTDIYNIDMSSL